MLCPRVLIRIGFELNSYFTSEAYVFRLAGVKGRWLRHLLGAGWMDGLMTSHCDVRLSC